MPRGRQPLSDYQQRIRASELVRKVYIEGKSHVQAGKEMGISHDTVERSLAWARAANLFVEHEQKVFTELLPLAHEAAKLALQDGNAQVALEILKGTNVLKKQGSDSRAAREDEESLYGEIARIRAGNVINITPHASIEPTGNEERFLSSGVREGGVHGEQETAEIKIQDRIQDVDGSTPGVVEGELLP